MSEWQYEKEHIKLLDQYGHLKDVSEHDVDSLILQDNQAKDAVQSYQDMWSEELDELTHLHHGRPSIPDGDYGPATEHLLRMPRCGQPDNVGESLEQAIPDSCRFKITTSYKPGMVLRGLTSEVWKKVWEESNLRLMEAVECTLTHNPNGYPNTIFFAFPQRLGGSVLADHILGNSCRPHRGRYDSDRTWSETLAVAVAAHEKVHGLGVSHTNAPGALMNPFIHSAARQRRGKLIDADIRMLERVGYKRRTSPVPDPDPTPKPGEKFLTGSATVHTSEGPMHFTLSGVQS